ncbi:SRPBCC domain-containing protein [Pimelobacter simplex]|uniref:SRPBCC family protein n=1 Tax=Nocardioides simplex TaxID=2045 RepID=UPI003810F28E
MSPDGLRALFDDEGPTPLIRTDFSDDAAWRAVVEAVTAPARFDDGDEGYVPGIVVVDDPAYAGLGPQHLVDALSGSDVLAFALLADARSMAESSAGADLTVAYVDLEFLDDEHDEDDEPDGSFPGRTFRCVAGEIASIEANLSISNMDFAEFADAVGEDGVFRGFPDDDEQDHLVVPEAEAGLAASVRIGRDVDRSPGARTLSGPTGTVDVTRTIRAQRNKRLFLDFAHVTSWSHLHRGVSSWTWGGARTETLGSPQWGTSWESQDQLTGSRGDIRYVFLEVDPPRRAVRRWDWEINPRPVLDPSVDAPEVIVSTTVTVTLEESRDGEDQSWTEVRITHDDLPVEWVDDMRDWWTFQLAIADHAGFGQG